MAEPLDQALTELRAALDAIDAADALGPPATTEEIQLVRDEIAPFILPDSVEQLWLRHRELHPIAGVAMTWHSPAEALTVRGYHQDTNEPFAGSWPYWVEHRWLPIATDEAATGFVVLGLESTEDSPVGIHSSQTLDLRAPWSSVVGYLSSLIAALKNPRVEADCWWELTTDPETAEPALHVDLYGPLRGSWPSRLGVPDTA